MLKSNYLFLNISATFKNGGVFFCYMQLRYHKGDIEGIGRVVVQPFGGHEHVYDRILKEMEKNGAINMDGMNGKAPIVYKTRDRPIGGTEITIDPSFHSAYFSAEEWKQREEQIRRAGEAFPEYYHPEEMRLSGPAWASILHNIFD